MNAYDMLQEVRANIGESTAAQWSDKELLRKLSANQKRVAMLFILSPGDWLMKSTDLTPSASVITLPDDCAKPVYMEVTSTGHVIPIRQTVRERRITRPEGTTFFVGNIDAYFVGNTLVVNQDSYTEGVTLWYQQRVVDLIAGTADTGSEALKIIIPTSVGPSFVDDAYNDVVLEIVGGTLVGTVTTVSDYTGSSRTLVIAETASTSTIFGSRSIVPEEGHDYIVLLSTLQALAKPGSTLEQFTFTYWRDLVRQAKKDLEEFIATRKSGSSHVRITEVE